MDELIEGSDLDVWEQQAAECGLLLHERQAVLAAVDMLSGALAGCIDVPLPPVASVLDLCYKTLQRSSGEH